MAGLAGFASLAHLFDLPGGRLMYIRGSQPVLRRAPRALCALPRGSVEPQELRVHFPGAPRTLQENNILTISCVLVVAENKLRYYGKFQSF